MIGWASVLGGLHAVVLCFVPEAEAPPHIELFSKVGVDCFVSELLVMASGCGNHIISKCISSKSWRHGLRAFF